MTNYLNLSIKEIHELLVKKEITPLFLVKEALKMAKEDKNNAFEYIMEKEALEIASKLTVPEIDNLLWGIPFVIKDNISTKDVPTCASSEILKGYVPIFNATIFEKLLLKKAIPIAKTTLDELALGGTGTTGHLGVTFNPYDKTHQRIIGGSSCGSAASVCEGIVPFSIGSDTGDSVRKPASYSGIVGFKPTWGRISRFGLFPFANSLDTIGFFANNVEDCAILLNETAGHDDKDVTSLQFLKNDYVSFDKKDFNNIKIAVIKEIEDSIKNTSIKEKFKDILKSLKDSGAKINYVSIDKKILRTIFPTYFIISCAEAVSNNANLDGLRFGKYMPSSSYEESLLKARTSGFSKNVKKRFIFGNFVLLENNQKNFYLRAKKNRNRIIKIINNILEENDAIMLPSSASIAPKINDVKNNDYYFSDEFLIAENHMAIGNFVGCPSITIPAGFYDNMPFGFNLTGRVFKDKELLNIAKIIEDKIDFKSIKGKK